MCAHTHTHVQSMGFSPKDSKAALDEHGSVAAAVEAMVYKTGIYMYMKVHVYSTPEKEKGKKEKGKRKNHKYINTQPETNTHKIKEIIFKNSLYGLGKY